MKKVHITDANGKCVYNHLLDDGSNCLAFESGFGCIDKLDVQREHWNICEGWKESVHDHP